MKGISLIEIIVAIALIASLSAIGTNSFINIKNDAEIDAITDELISDIKLARNKSMNGELLENETVEDFTSDGLPKYGIDINENDYQIVRNCKKTLDDCSSEGPIDSYYINSKYILLPDIEFFFERITGTASAQKITVKEKNDNYKREINISENFIITVNE